MKKQLLMTGLILALLIGCAAGPNPLSAGEEDLAGFWKGLWHGFIMLFTFIISLFKDSVSIYEVHNNGGWYNFGFLFGAMMFWSGGNKASSERKKSKAKKPEMTPEKSD